MLPVQKNAPLEPNTPILRETGFGSFFQNTELASLKRERKIMFPDFTINCIFILNFIKNKQYKKENPPPK